MSRFGWRCFAYSPVNKGLRTYLTSPPTHLPSGQTARRGVLRGVRHGDGKRHLRSLRQPALPVRCVVPATDDVVIRSLSRSVSIGILYALGTGFFVGIVLVALLAVASPAALSATLMVVMAGAGGRAAAVEVRLTPYG